MTLDADVGGFGTLVGQRRAGIDRQPIGQRLQVRHGIRGQRHLDRLLAHHRLVGEAHAVRGQHAGEGMDEHRFHAQRIGDQAGVLAAGAAETLQRKARDVVALLHRNLLDRICHVGHGDAQEPLGGLLRRARMTGGARDFLGQFGEFCRDHVGVQLLVAARAEDRREVRRLDFPHADVRVGHRERAAAAVAGRAGICAGAVRADSQPRAVEVQDGAAARRHRIDRHHRGAHAHAGHLGLERALESAGIQRDVGGGAAHVEADDVVQASHARGARGADDAAGRSGQDRVLALEGVRLGQPAVGLHEIQPGAREFGGDLIDVAPQDRRQIGVHHRRVAARHQPQQRADRVAGGDLGEPRLARQLGQALLVRRIFPCVQQNDRAGVDACLARVGEVAARGGFVQRLDFLAVDADAAVDFYHLLVQHGGQGDREVEQARARLVADAERVGEASVDDQQDALALALEQGVGGDGGAHLHGVDLAGGIGWSRGMPSTDLMPARAASR